MVTSKYLQTFPRSNCWRSSAIYLQGTSHGPMTSLLMFRVSKKAYFSRKQFLSPQNENHTVHSDLGGVGGEGAGFSEKQMIPLSQCPSPGPVCPAPGSTTSRAQSSWWLPHDHSFAPWRTVSEEATSNTFWKYTWNYNMPKKQLNDLPTILYCSINWEYCENKTHGFQVIELNRITSSGRTRQRLALWHPPPKLSPSAPPIRLIKLPTN